MSTLLWGDIGPDAVDASSEVAPAISVPVSKGPALSAVGVLVLAGARGMAVKPVAAKTLLNGDIVRFNQILRHKRIAPQLEFFATNLLRLLTGATQDLHDSQTLVFPDGVDRDAGMLVFYLLLQLVFGGRVNEGGARVYHNGLIG